MISPHKQVRHPLLKVSSIKWLNMGPDRLRIKAMDVLFEHTNGFSVLFIKTHTRRRSQIGETVPLTGNKV